MLNINTWIDLFCEFPLAFHKLHLTTYGPVLNRRPSHKTKANEFQKLMGDLNTLASSSSWSQLVLGRYVLQT